MTKKPEISDLLIDHSKKSDWQAAIHFDPHDSGNVQRLKTWGAFCALCKLAGEQRAKTCLYDYM